GVAHGRHWLLVRRCLDDPHELAYYLVWAPPDTPLSLMVQAIGARWHIEEDLHACKALGLDHYEVRSYLGWYRHLTLVLLAAAFPDPFRGLLRGVLLGNVLAGFAGTLPGVVPAGLRLALVPVVRPTPKE